VSHSLGLGATVRGIFLVDVTAALIWVGFHISSAMLERVKLEFREAFDTRTSLFSGEVEGGKADEPITAVATANFKPIYDFI
jgi:hypothetical protein